jgi:hypothetical protein
MLALDLMCLKDACAVEYELRADSKRRFRFQENRAGAAMKDLQDHAHRPSGFEMATELRGLAATPGSHRIASLKRGPNGIARVPGSDSQMVPSHPIVGGKAAQTQSARLSGAGLDGQKRFAY